MQHIRSFCRRRGRALAGVLLAALAVLVLAWAGFDLSARVDGRSTLAIVNDEYSQTLELQGLTQALPLRAEQTLYGVSLNLTTYGHAFATGTLHAQLATAGGAVVGTAAAPCIDLLDNTFKTLLFDTPYTPAADETLYLTLWADGFSAEEAALPLGLWASVGVQAADARGGVPGLLPLTGADGQPLDASAALQYVVGYAGHWSVLLSLLLGALLLAAVLGCFALLARRRACWAVVVCGALLLGGAFALLTPPLVAPDEYTHLAISYEAASAALGQPVAEPGTGALLVRACDAPYFESKSGPIGIFAYKTWLSGLTVTGCDPAPTVASEFTAGTQSGAAGYLYLPQTAGLLLARLCGLGFHGMLLAGRLANLLVFAALAALAAALCPPARRWLLACVLLLPQTLQLAASLSPDAGVLGLAFCYTALCLRLRWQPARRRQLALLAALALALGPAKAIYLPLALLVCIVPAENLDPRGPGAAPLRLGRLSLRGGTLVKALALALAAAGWAALNLESLVFYLRDFSPLLLAGLAVAAATAAALLALVYWKAGRTPRGRRVFWGVLAAAACAACIAGVCVLVRLQGTVPPEMYVTNILPNGESAYTYTAGYILRSLPATLKLLLRSASAQGAAWLQGLLGTALGEPIVYPIAVSWLLGVGLVAALLAAAVPEAETPLLTPRACAGGWGIVAVVVALTFFIALAWTPINYDTIFGVQGRYWLPILPLALVLLGNGRAMAARPGVGRRCTLAVVCLTSLVILQGAGLYAAWQMEIK